MPRLFPSPVSLAALAAALTAPTVLDAQQTAIPDYDEASDVFWEALYPEAFEEVYCGRAVPSRGAHNIEHVFPAFWMTKTAACGSRKTCRRSSPLFNRMEADLHNLYPSRTDVNNRRGSLPFGMLEGEHHDFPSCDFEEAMGQVEPRPASRGNVARAVLYMTDAYGAEHVLPPGQLELMQLWDKQDPPDAAERARNDRIAALQGNRNPFIDAHDTAAPQPAPDPEPAPETVRVRIATWNIENLHGVEGEPLPGRPSAARRSAADFARIAAYINRLDADIIAFQEVNGPDAARRVFPEAEYDIVVSDRFDEDAVSGVETDHIYTGVAVRKGGAAFFIAGGTYGELSVQHNDGGRTRPTRRGTEVLVELPNGEPLQLMSVHLKSGCPQQSLQPPQGENCISLAVQRDPLEAWIDALTEEGTPFAIAGDWNRRLDIHGPRDHFWEAIDDGDPAPLDLFRYPEFRDSPCLSGTPDHRPKPVDFVVLDEQAARWAASDSVAIVDFDAADKPERAQISDHCPVVVDLQIPVPPESALAQD